MGQVLRISRDTQRVKTFRSRFGYRLWLVSGAQGPGLSVCGRYLPGILRCHRLCLAVGCFGLRLVGEG